MITIIIPTRNRPHFVARLLQYYAGQKFRHTIFIGDSSEGKKADEMLGVVKEFDSRLKVFRFDCRGNSYYGVMQVLLKKVQTPYSCYLADDDFLVVPTIDEGVAFMETHPDYAGVSGKALLFRLRQGTAYGPFEATSPYDQVPLESADPSQRLLNHLHQYTSMFHSVCRTEWLKKAVRHSDDLMEGTCMADKTWLTASVFGELTTSLGVVLRGKIKVLNSLYYVRQVHDKRLKMQDWFDWVTSPNWNRCYQILKGQVLEDLLEQGENSERGEQALKDGLWPYLDAFSSISWRGYRNMVAPKQTWKDHLKKIPGVQKTFRMIHPFGRDMSLRALSKNSSPHHDRFWPIYSLITKGGSSCECL